MEKKEKLVKQLLEKTQEKDKSFRLFIISIAIAVLCFLLDGIYNALLIVSYRHEEKTWAKKLLSFLHEYFHFLLLLWILGLVISLSLIIY